MVFHRSSFYFFWLLQSFETLKARRTMTDGSKTLSRSQKEDATVGVRLVGIPKELLKSDFHFVRFSPCFDPPGISTLCFHLWNDFDARFRSTAEGPMPQTEESLCHLTLSKSRFPGCPLVCCRPALLFLTAKRNKSLQKKCAKALF